MTPEHLTTILKQANVTTDKDGWEKLPEGASLTLYLAHGGVSLTVNRVEAVHQDGNLMYARTHKKDTFAVSREDVFAVGLDAGAEAPRRAGFG